MPGERRPGKVRSGFPSGRANKNGLTKDEAWKIILAVPGAQNRLWFNQPSGFLHDRFLAKVHHKEPAVTLQVGSMEMRDMMLEAELKLFYITEHYRNFPFILARLSALTPNLLKELIAGRAAHLAETPPKKTRKAAKKVKKLTRR
jgi:hypothetical protein